jgi:OOP family OmpA-OmpF porin
MTPISRRHLAPFAVAIVAWLAPLAAAALDLSLPGSAVRVLSETENPGRHEFATGPWRDGAVPTRGVSGVFARSVWRLPADGAAPGVQGLADALERQLEEQGYEIALSCRDRACGGFDFRAALDLGRAPEMHVDIGNFRYVSALRNEGEAAAAITVSRGGDTLHVHVARIDPDAALPEGATRSSRAPVAEDDGALSRSLVETLQAEGSVALDDLAFRTGASELSAADYGSLRDLAAFLSANPGRRVILVGHTDSRGGAESNVALSEARAQAVRDHLVERLGADPAQVETAGIGFLAPRATNATGEGREANRRVEVVLLEGG